MHVNTYTYTPQAILKAILM